MTATQARPTRVPARPPALPPRAPGPVPDRRRRQWLTGPLPVVFALLVTAGVLLLALRTGALLGRMTTDVATAQQQATNLANSQRQALLLLREATAVEAGGDPRPVELQRGLLERQLAVSEAQFPAGSAQRHELAELQAAIGGFRWPALAEPGRSPVLQVSAEALASYVDQRVKWLYSQQETYFYQATTESLRAKRATQNALAGLVGLASLLGLAWVVLLKRRTRSDLARVNARLRHQATHDALTGLPNRTLLMSRLTDVVGHAVATGGTAATVLVDLDGFKNVNDTLGHRVGDDVLRQVAGRLRGCVRSRETVARLGGDEFAIVLPGGTAEHGLAVARAVLAALRRPIGVEGQETRVGASVGVAELDGHPSAEELLSDADIAMYAAKRAGRGRVLRFEPEMRERTLQRGRLEQELGRAVARGQIEVHYQPIIDLAGRRVVGVEALARWRRSDGEVVPPAVFIPIAEESGLICEIGGEVLRRACRTVRDWRSQVPGAGDLSVSVNVSGWQILSADYSLLVADALAASGLPPDALTLEITESVLLEDSEALTAELARLRTLRVKLAIDDFGAGYSSLSSLRRFPVDVLKIDRMFLDLGAERTLPLVRAVTELGRSLGLTIVAEGVETAEHLALVRAAGCDAVQGYLISRPLPEPDARLFLSWAASTDQIPALLAR